MIDVSFFQQLKSKTSNCHNHLEKTFPFSTLMQPKRFDENSYYQVLATMAAFHQCMRLFAPSKLNTKLSSLLSCESTLEAVMQDLNSLQPASTLAPSRPLKIASTDIHSLLAFAYVWAGSSMGAQILIRWLRKSESSLPMRYYQTMAAQSANWLQVKVLISEQLRLTDIQPDLIIAHAINWFEGIIAYARTVSTPKNLKRLEYAQPL
ncbi:biliverdin-producing heme oxygenase [Alteromonas sp. ASW11-130]|uniref:biliverdin-producing heme oxygenase n=1 Tax=Alteromonas sp. ASW11-130 TaxID=3015775 RepID=UPI002242A193|nr:biliverdin-producing heme oxygenase [Alteromonas sp. ASW11-130]MCW8090609.1 biliverdin-producing heme oxygenase [Alteromonas sp. ASW11-130]